MILVESPGMLTTVQDLGRPGYGPLGVSPSGAADSIALRIGNLLVGNSLGAAALEMTLAGGRYRFSTDTTVAVTGSECAVPVWKPLMIRADDVLDIGRIRGGSRAYLCVRGGIDVPGVLGSASTYLLSRIGGHQGRALKTGDRLPIGASQGEPPAHAIRCEILARLAARKRLRVTHTVQSDWFTDRARCEFVTTSYRVTPEADRMGVRLQGTALMPQQGHLMITEGVSLGAVQAPSSGQPIILFVEQQTTGGYPKIANVISADIPSVGQLRPGDEVRFEWVSIPTARALLFEQESLLAPEILFA